MGLLEEVRGLLEVVGLLEGVGGLLEVVGRGWKGTYSKGGVEAVGSEVAQTTLAQLIQPQFQNLCCEFILPFIHQPIYPSIHQPIHPYISPFIHPPTHPFIHPYIHSSTNPSIYPSIHSFHSHSSHQPLLEEFKNFQLWTLVKVTWKSNKVIISLLSRCCSGCSDHHSEYPSMIIIAIIIINNK